jgi:hypothetical protein
MPHVLFSLSVAYISPGSSSNFFFELAVAAVTYVASSSSVRILVLINLVCALVPALVWSLLRRGC